MCGIFGFVGSWERNLGEQCTDRLAHRGPDGRDSLYHPEHQLFLGHRRLSILDLSSSGSQPMTYQHLQIVFNGEIYNYLELKKQLIGLGHTFKTSTDTEVLAASFLEWGVDCLLKMEGMWSFAIWDKNHQRLFLARDRLGKKPLFYFHNKNGFAFGSEMKALTPLLTSPSPNKDIMNDRSRVFSYEATEECLIKEINRLRPGHFLEYRCGQISQKRWWCTLDHLPEKHLEEKIENLEKTLQDSVRLRLRSDVPISTALSGGIDSSLIACLVKQVGLTKEYFSFTASFPGSDLDETQAAKSIAKQLEIPWQNLEIKPSTDPNELLRFLYLFEETYITSPIPFMQLYGAISKAGYKVSLDGHGADELFGGYEFDVPYGFANGPTNWPATLKTLRGMIPGQSSAKEIAQIMRFAGSYFRQKFSGKLLRSQDEHHPRWKNLDPLAKRLYIETHETILPTLLRNYDRYSMSAGVEIRMPFLDSRVLTLATSFSAEERLAGGFSKSPLRQILRKHLQLPNVTDNRRKIGFNSPTIQWLQGPLKSFFSDFIGSRRFMESSLADGKTVSQKIQKVISNPHATFADGEDAWFAISPFLWEEAWRLN